MARRKESVLDAIASMPRPFGFAWNLVQRLLLGFCLASSATLSAEPSRMVLPTPKGLIACAPGDQLVRTLGAAMSLIGEVVGCFHSAERIQLKGIPRDIRQPLETAFALNIAPYAGPYAKADLDAMFQKVSGQWKSYKALNQQVRREYERQINAWVASSLPANAPARSAKLEPPVLVSIERIGSGAYMVVSIRKRKIQAAGDTVVSTSIETTAVTLRNGALIRLSIARELRQPADIQIVHDETAAWIRQVASSTPSH